MAAGLGFKTFTTGEVLTAADTNGYLMQGVLVFASAAARDAAITSPQEGQFAYLKDTNVTTYYTGSAWTNLDTTGMTNPMTTTGDMVYSSSGSTPARLGIGSTGQVITVAGGIPSWATPATTGFIGCSVTKSAVQSVANNTSTTLTWNGELFDTSAFHDNSTNNSRITIPTGKDGYYQINGWAGPTGNATGVRAVTICKNVGLTVLADSSLAAVASTSIGFGVNVVANLVAGDYLQLVVYQTSGGSLNYNYESFVTYFSVTYLGA